MAHDANQGDLILGLERCGILPVATNAVVKVASMAAEPAALKMADITSGNCLTTGVKNIGGGFLSVFSFMPDDALKNVQVAKLDRNTALKDMAYLIVLQNQD